METVYPSINHPTCQRLVILTVCLSKSCLFSLSWKITCLGRPLWLNGRFIQVSRAQGQKCHYFDEIFIIGGTGSCQNDNFQCCHWWKFRQNDDIFVSVWLVPVQSLLSASQCKPDMQTSHLVGPEQDKHFLEVPGHSVNKSTFLALDIISSYGFT